MYDINERIRQSIQTPYLPGESRANLTDDTPLRTSDVLDSVATLTAVDFVEKEVDLELEPRETGIEAFDDIGAIARLVEERRAGASRS